MPTSKAVSLGGASADVKIGSIAYGLMMMTWTPTPTPDEQAFEAIKTAIEQVPEGSKLFINSAEFYGMAPRTANLHLVARFFTKYPELANRTFISVKGGTGADDMIPDSSPENIRRSVDAVIKALDGKKKLDLFECARVDSRVSIEDTMITLKALVEEGKFDHIGLSEVSAETIRRANKIHPVTAVEIEVSPWSYEPEAKKVIATAKELGVTVIAYSPLGRGFLTGQLKVDDLPKGDMRTYFARFQGDAVVQNQKFVDILTALAAGKGITPAQLSLAWIVSLGVVPIPGSSKPSRVMENMSAANVEFTAEELVEITEIIESNAEAIEGGRYMAKDGKGEHLWG